MNHEERCACCDRVNFQTSTIEGQVFDAYCVACRGLFNHMTRTGGIRDYEVTAAIKRIFGNTHKRKPGTYTEQGLTATVIRI